MTSTNVFRSKIILILAGECVLCNVENYPFSMDLTIQFFTVPSYASQNVILEWRSITTIVNELILHLLFLPLS